MTYVYLNLVNYVMATFVENITKKANWPDHVPNIKLNVNLMPPQNLSFRIGSKTGA